MSQGRPTLSEATKYAESWILGGNQSKAWRHTFPKSRARQKVVHEKASGFHKCKKVQERIAQLQELLKTQSELEFGLTVRDIKERLAKAADMGLGTKLDAQGNKIAISIPGAVSALSEINKMDGNHAPTRLAHGGDPDAPPVAVKVTKTVIDGK